MAVRDWLGHHDVSTTDRLPRCFLASSSCQRTASRGYAECPESHAGSLAVATHAGAGALRGSGVFVAPDRSEPILARWEERLVFLFSRLPQRPRASCCSARRCLVTDPGSGLGSYRTMPITMHSKRTGHVRAWRLRHRPRFQTRCLERRCPRRGHPPSRSRRRPRLLTPRQRRYCQPLLRSQRPRPGTGQTFEGHCATGAIAKHQFSRVGLARGCGSSGGSQLGSATPRSSLPTAARSRSSNAASRRVVTAYEVETGRELWAHGWDAEFVEFQGGNGPPRHPRPTTRGGFMRSVHLGELRALDSRASGALQWPPEHPHRQRRHRIWIGACRLPRSSSTKR